MKGIFHPTDTDQEWRNCWTGVWFHLNNPSTGRAETLTPTVSTKFLPQWAKSLWLKSVWVKLFSSLLQYTTVIQKSHFLNIDCSPYLTKSSSFKANTDFHIETRWYQFIKSSFKWRRMTSCVEAEVLETVAFWSTWSS